MVHLTSTFRAVMSDSNYVAQEDSPSAGVFPSAVCCSRCARCPGGCSTHHCTMCRMLAPWQPSRRCQAAAAGREVLVPLAAAVLLQQGVQPVRMALAGNTHVVAGWVKPVGLTTRGKEGGRNRQQHRGVAAGDQHTQHQDPWARVESGGQHKEQKSCLHDAHNAHSEFSPSQSAVTGPNLTLQCNRPI